MKTLRVLMIGATGAVGKATVAHLLELPQLESLTLLVRKEVALFASDKRLKQIVVDFDRLDTTFKSDEDLRGHNVIVSSLGTTKSIAKDNTTYRRIEVDYPVNFARLAKGSGASHAVLVSSSGASRTSWIRYLAQKGEVEEAWASLGFDTLTILRPGLIARGADARPAEKLYAWLQKPIPCEILGQAIAHRLNDIFSSELKASGPLIQTNADIYKQAKT